MNELRSYPEACTSPATTPLAWQALRLPRETRGRGGRYKAKHGLGTAARVFLLFSLPAALVLAGGGPQNVLVVVNDASRDSLELGHYYREQRGIPEANLCHITTSTSSVINTSTFSNEIQGPVLAYITAAGLSNQVDYVVFSKDIPSRVQSGTGETNVNSLTSAMFYGYKNSPPPCSLPADTVNDYFGAEAAFRRGDEPSNGRYLLSTLLTCYTLDQARQLVDRGVRADYTAPTGTIYFMHTSDVFRNVRWPQFEEVDFMIRGLASPVQGSILNNDEISSRSNVVGYAQGRQTVPSINTLGYPAGALAEHLTSFGGKLFDSGPGQMSVLEWIRFGVSGSYGTVVEPCSYTEKFPHAALYYGYLRGFNLAESMYLAVENPYQGLVVGDPLCQPYALAPAVAVYGMASHETVSGLVSLSVTGLAARADRPVSRLDLFIDGRFVALLTNVPPRAGNTVVATLEGTDCSYEVGPSDALADIAAGLAASINASGLGITAAAANGRVELVQEALGVAGTGLAYSVATLTNTADRLTLSAWTPATNFLETAYPARQRVTATGTVTAGDQLRAVVTRLDSVEVTNVVIASAGDTTLTLMQALRAAVNADPELQGTTGCSLEYVRTVSGTLVEGFFVARTNHWDSYDLHLDYDAIGLVGPNYDGPFASNQDVLSARGTILLYEGLERLGAAWSLDTTNLADGPHTLRAVAYEGGAPRTQGHEVRPFVVSNNTIACAITNPVPDRSFPFGDVVTVQVSATVSPGSITSVCLFVEGKPLAGDAGAPYVFAWHTSSNGPGIVGLQARAYADSGPVAQSPVLEVRVYTDDDRDGLPGWWEYQHFGGDTLAPAAGDSDGDRAHNLMEYEADTDPTNAGSVFTVTRLAGLAADSPAVLTFSSRPTRQYDVQRNDVSVTETSAWTTVSGSLFRGEDATTTWTNSVGQDFGFYRVRAHLP